MRFFALPFAALSPFAWEAVAIATGAIAAAWATAGWLKRISANLLARMILVLLIVLGAASLVEGFVGAEPSGLLPASLPVRVLVGLLAGLAIGAIASLLGVAGGEVIIPTLIFGYGAPVKTAGSLSLLISLPTVAAGVIRHWRAQAYGDTNLVRTVCPWARVR